MKDGSKAFEEKNYDLAIQKFQEGYEDDPDFPGSAPVFLNNKAIVLIERGTTSYNQSLKSDQTAKNAAREAAKNDFEEAISSSETGLEILKNAVSDSAEIKKDYKTNTLTAFTNRKNSYRLLSQTGADRTNGLRAITVFREYMAVETDPIKKDKAHLELAQTLQDSDEFELAAAKFEKIIQADPNNIDALAGAGLNLVNVGYTNPDIEKGKTQLKEAAKYLQRYDEIAPENHKFKKEAQGIIESLKETQNPQKALSPKNNSKGGTKVYSIANTASY